ncbi:SERTA domain-containing protein 2 [Mantella aurantiaca]
MLGKAGKRKFDEHEDGLESKVVSPTDGPSKVSYTLQRQTIFNISLMKLYNHRPLTEPRLQKTVLINNMLRRIQEELKQEGSLRPVFISTSQSPDPLCDTYQEAQPAFSHLASQPILQPTDLINTTPLESCLTPASLLEEDTFCTSQTVQQNSPSSKLPPPSPPTVQPVKDSFSSALDEIEDLCPTSTSTEAMSAVDLKDGTITAGSLKSEGTQENRTSEPKLMDSLPGNFELTTSTGFLTDLTLDDILFSDIDTSMYDFDPCTSNAGAASKMAPDELLKTLSPYSSQPVTPNQPFKMDLTELDHIMEVLVGS